MLATGIDLLLSGSKKFFLKAIMGNNPTSYYTTTFLLLTSFLNTSLCRCNDVNRNFMMPNFAPPPPPRTMPTLRERRGGGGELPSYPGLNQQFANGDFGGDAFYSSSNNNKDNIQRLNFERLQRQQQQQQLFFQDEQRIRDRRVRRIRAPFAGDLLTLRETQQQQPQQPQRRQSLLLPPDFPSFPRPPTQHQQVSTTIDFFPPHLQPVGNNNQLTIAPLAVGNSQPTRPFINDVIRRQQSPLLFQQQTTGEAETTVNLLTSLVTSTITPMPMNDLRDAQKTDNFAPTSRPEIQQFASLGVRCTADAECANMTAAYCDATTKFCSCPVGLNAIPLIGCARPDRHFGEACIVDRIFGDSQCAFGGGICVQGKCQCSSGDFTFINSPCSASCPCPPPLLCSDRNFGMCQCPLAISALGGKGHDFGQLCSLECPCKRGLQCSSTMDNVINMALAAKTVSKITNESTTGTCGCKSASLSADEDGLTFCYNDCPCGIGRTCINGVCNCIFPLPGKLDMSCSESCGCDAGLRCIEGHCHCAPEDDRKHSGAICSDQCSCALGLQCASNVCRCPRERPSQLGATCSKHCECDSPLRCSVDNQCECILTGSASQEGDQCSINCPCKLEPNSQYELLCNNLTSRCSLCPPAPFGFLFFQDRHNRMCYYMRDKLTNIPINDINGLRKMCKNFIHPLASLPTLTPRGADRFIYQLLFDEFLVGLLVNSIPVKIPLDIVLVNTEAVKFGKRFATYDGEQLQLSDAGLIRRAVADGDDEAGRSISNFAHKNNSTATQIYLEAGFFDKPQKYEETIDDVDYSGTMPAGMFAVLLRGTSTTARSGSRMGRQLQEGTASLICEYKAQQSFRPDVLPGPLSIKAS